MAEHIERGRKGEALAAGLLEGKGFLILERNWRSGHREIDIIALDGETIVFTEVKVRNRLGNERLEEHFTWKKQRNLLLSAEAYLAYRNLDREVRFDVILISGKGTDRKIEHIEDAFGAWD